MLLYILLLVIFGCCLQVVSQYEEEEPPRISRKGSFEWIQEEQILRKAVSLADFEDTRLQFVGLVQKHGYPVEVHKTQTPDGYILTIHRMPGKNNPEMYRGVVFLQHGLLGHGNNWILAGPEKGLAYLLANHGYDVWIGNARGCNNYKNHTNSNITDEQFWDFSWHEISVNDLPTMIDYILATTGEEKLFYVGHSQGTTNFYVMCAEKPEYNNKIRAQFSLAPIAYIDHMKSGLMKVVALAEKTWKGLLQLIGMHQFMPPNHWIISISNFICGEEGILQPLCENVMFAFGGFNKKQTNATLMPIIMSHTPGGIASKQLLHYAQLVNTAGLFRKAKFRRYDNGILGNLKSYGQIFPPDYELSKVTAPVYLFHSNNDWLTADIDVMRLKDELGNCQGKFLIPDDTEFSHMDFLFGIDVPNLVYNRIIDIMQKH